jgi:L-alanine-DL-glutamate epimerase-like enolase superfamily enzyme
MVEFLLRPQVAKQALHAGAGWPERGSLALPTQPGLGVELDSSKIDSRRAL